MPQPGKQKVLAGFHTSLDSDEIDAFIADAGVLLRQAYDEDELDDNLDTVLWKYLARHLIRFEPGQEREKKTQAVGNAQQTFSGSFGEQLRATSPGQMALTYAPDDSLEDLTENTDDLFFRSV